MPLLRLNGVSKSFRHQGGRMTLREHAAGLWRRRGAGGFAALTEVSFELAAGESVALLGSNGAGKSTLLSVICGLAEPDAGEVEVRGSMAAMLDLGAGFHPDLTGRENLMLNAAYYGMTRAQAVERFGRIVEFAELEEFIEEPLRTYSEGMKLRLGFSVATHAEPELMLLDEVLGVGDSAFQAKCRARLKELQGEGRSLLCVSHHATLVEEFCERAIWLHKGRVVMDGGVRAVAAAYGKGAAAAGH